MAYQKLQASRAFEVVKSDTVNIVSPNGGSAGASDSCVLYVGIGGSLAVITAGGDSVVFSNIQSGSFIPVNVVRVLVTGTTANNIIALW